MSAMTFKDRALCKLLRKAVAKKKPEELEVWEKALMEVPEGQRGDWTDKSYILPILEACGQGACRRVVYLAGGCFWGVEELFRQIPGVEATQTGYANGNLSEGVTYQRVCQGDTDFRETVRVTFDPDVVSVEQLLWAYFQIVDPTITNRQGNDVGTQYQAGIYWEADDAELGTAIQRVADQKRASIEAQGRPFAVEVHELANYFPAEDYHQYYLVKNPGGYCHISRAEMAEVLQALT